MENYMSDIFQKRDEILEEWVRNFLATSLDAGTDIDEFSVGDSDGEVPEGIKIIFDGYGEDDDGNDNKNDLSFAVFIHKESVNGVFPEHDYVYNMIIHRLTEEMHFWVWYEVDTDQILVVPDVEFAETGMEEDEAVELFSAVVEKLGLQTQE